MLLSRVRRCGPCTAARRAARPFTVAGTPHPPASPRRVWLPLPSPSLRRAPGVAAPSPARPALPAPPGIPVPQALPAPSPGNGLQGAAAPGAGLLAAAGPRPPAPPPLPPGALRGLYAWLDADAGGGREALSPVDLHNYVPTCNSGQKRSNWNVLNRQGWPAWAAPTLGTGCIPAVGFPDTLSSSSEGSWGLPTKRPATVSLRHALPGIILSADLVSHALTCQKSWVTNSSGPASREERQISEDSCDKSHEDTGRTTGSVSERKVFHKLGLSVSEEEIRKVVVNTPGAIEPILCAVRDKVEASEDPPGMAAHVGTAAWPWPLLCWDTGSLPDDESKTRNCPAREPWHRLDPGLPQQLLEEKERALAVLQETIKVLQMKVARLEHLVKLKDQSVGALMHQGDQPPRRGAPGPEGPLPLSTRLRPQAHLELP
ncbi:uncharacterized protein LOC120873661 [Oryx dammah]|uniref:uncharacterized protein LOC120873661 n=1 Tax=Oryx dammah TaxID=59534 RepID=UPI001A9ADC51|nr:uncharacterized protein LOC120873661 [Oryx dammah]